MDKQTIQTKDFIITAHNTKRTRQLWARKPNDNHLYRVYKTRKGEYFIKHNGIRYFFMTLGHPTTQADFIN